MDAGLAAVAAAGTTAIFALLTSLLHNRSASQRDRISALLPARREAVEYLWSTFVHAGRGTPDDPDRINRCIELSIWLPESVRAELLHAVRDLPDVEAMKRGQGVLLKYVDSLTGGDGS